MIQRTVARHNKKADALGCPKITRRIHSHGFRYFAQIRDELAGVPRSVQKKQRGWSPSSSMPDKYAAIVSKNVDDYFAKKFELNGGKEKAEENITCPRCRDVNFPKSLYCRRCSLPLNDKAKKYDEAIDDLMAKILLDPELSHRLWVVLLGMEGFLYSHSYRYRYGYNYPGEGADHAGLKENKRGAGA